jgi:cytochrome P450
LAQLKYLNACIEEGLRMYPPVPSGLPRVTPPGGAAICGTWISANASRTKQVSHPTQYLTFSKTTVYVTQYASYTSPTNFRAPNDYIPERWISSEYDSDHKSVLQPFSVGPRNCLGKKYVPLIALFHRTQSFMLTVPQPCLSRDTAPCRNNITPFQHEHLCRK